MLDWLRDRLRGSVPGRHGLVDRPDDLFYLPSVHSAEDRLRFYAGHFNTGEVDSTYYALPAERNAKLWAERTPERFILTSSLSR